MALSSATPKCKDHRVTFDDIVDRLVISHEPIFEDSIRAICSWFPDTIREQFVSASSMSDAELAVPHRYVEYYLSTRGDKIIPDQFRRNTEYAFIIAPLMAKLFSDDQLTQKFVGDTVEYSFASVYLKSQPEPSGYDPKLILGAVILRFAHCYDFAPEMACEVGASWKAVAACWDQLKSQTGDYVLEFSRNIKQGGTVHLADGVL